MRPLRRPRRRLIAVAGAIVIAVSIAVTGSLLLMRTGIHSTSATAPAASAIPTPASTPSPTFNGLRFPYPGAGPSGKTTVVWWVGLGAGGSEPNQLQAEEDFVSHYNGTNKDNVFLELDIPPGGVPANYTFEDGLAGTDIVGPGESSYLNTLGDHWLGLDDLIAKNKTDLSVYSQPLRNTFRNPSGQLEGLPYVEFPSFIFFNKDLFTAAGLPGLPTRVGEQYMGHDWTWDEATIAKQLTVDTSGRTSTEQGFNPAKTKSYGFDLQWVSNLRGFATAFGAGSYVAADGKTAQVPAVWGQAAKWYYDAMWGPHFAPTEAERSAPAMSNGTTVGTGRVAMDLAWTWTISSFGPHDASGNPTSTPPTPFKHWDMGVLPSNDGVTTAPIDVDTFVINKDTKNPDAAYKAMLAIMADPAMMASYGGMPVDPSYQAAYFKAQQDGVDAQFADNPITWSVLTEMARYASPEIQFDPDETAYVKATNDDQAFYTLLQTKGNLNLDTEIARFKATLQADFDAAAAPS